MPTTLVDYDFSADAGTWSSGTPPTHNTSEEGYNYTTGVAEFSANITGNEAAITFTPVTSGVCRVQFDIKVEDDAVGTAGADTWFYIYPDGAGTGSANSAAVLQLDRDSSPVYGCPTKYRSTSSFLASLTLQRGYWYRVAIDVDVTAKKYDIYFDGRIFVKGATCPNASMTDVGRFSVLHQSDTATTFVDNLKIISDPTLGTALDSVLVTDDFTLGSGAIEDSSPTVDNRNKYTQKWKSPDNTTTYGTFTRGATGLTPVSAKKTSALFRCAAEGVATCTYTLSATEANRYAGLLIRTWDGFGGANNGFAVLRYWGGAVAGSQVILSQGTTVLASQAGTYSGTLELSVEMRGGFMLCKANGTTLFSGWVGGFTRGLLSEENCGPLIDGTLGTVDTDNKPQSFSFSGHFGTETDKTIGNVNLLFGGAMVSEGYLTDATSNSQDNLFWSKGFQYGHYSTADANGLVFESASQWNTTNVLAKKSRSNCTTESEVRGQQSLNLTATRRGLWAKERYHVYLTSNITPDLDVRPSLWSNSFTTAGASTATSRTQGFANWALHESDVAEAAAQQLTAFGSGKELRVTRTTQPYSGIGATDFSNLSKWEGAGDPKTVACGNIQSTKQTADNVYEIIQAALIESDTGLAISTTLTEEWRDDIASPATFTSLSNLTLKTNASGDINTDGFNEQHGWYEFTYGGSGDAGLTNDSIKRIKPQFRLHSWTATDVTVTVAGSPVTAYADDLGDGSVLIQLDADVAATAAIVIAETTAGPTLSSATINAAGTTLTLVFSEAVTTDYTGLDVDGYTLSNGSGSGTDTITFTISQVYSDEAPALDYGSATGNVTGVSSGEPLGDLTDSAITNDSTVSPNPTVTTGAASSIGTATASVAGTVASEGRESVTERGVVWATTTAPETSDNKVTAGTGSGAFSASLTDLPDNTLIYFRAFATNASDTSYGAEDTFTTLDDPAPTITSVRFAEEGTRIRVAFSEAVTGTTGFTVDSGTITYVSGSGTAAYLFSFTGTPTTLSYTPGNVVDSISQALGASGPTAIGEELESSGSFFIEALGATISWSIGDSLSG